MSQTPMNETLQLVAWFFATIEFVLALYVLFLNVRHRANRHISVLLFFFAVGNLGLGIMIGAENVDQARFATYLLAATNASIQPMLFVVVLVLLKPEWLRGKWRWVGWLLYAMTVLPILLTVLDVTSGTALWYAGLKPDYTGGYVSRIAYVATGPVASFVKIFGTYVLGAVPVIPLAYIAFFDKTADKRTRQLAMLLFGTQVISIVFQGGLYNVMAPAMSSLIVSLIVIVSYAYVAFQQMVSERRVQRGRLQIRLTALIIAISVPLFVATSLIVNTRPAQYVSFLVVGLSVVLLFALTWLTIRQAIQPLRSLTATANDISAGNLERVAPVESEDEIGTLARAFNSMTAQLRDLIGDLEENVRDRTAMLERRSDMLQASSDVGRTVASILDREQLLSQVVESIRERFSLYYVGLFLVDEAGVLGEPGEWALLRAGTGQAGQAMLEREIRIQVGEGVPGWAIANAQARIASRAEADAVCLLYPELSHTRSELALPLRSRGRVLGVLTLHSDQLDAFDQDAVVVLQVLADQVAVALDNAELFAEREIALQEVRRAQGELTRDAWAELLRARADWGYSYNRRSLLPVQGQWPPEMVRAWQTGASVRWQRDAEPVLSVPVRARGQIVGVLNFDKSEAGMLWSDDEVRLIETLVGRLGEALETAQLYESAQQLAAREQMIGDMAAQFTSALDLDALLQTAVRELGQLPNVTEVSLHLDAPEA
ncbi:MAG: GAF domain-containing protein [Anaerolineae bacterium]|nr:GAF domain-containing protein [Anaerolineae bacterium]